MFLEKYSQNLTLNKDLEIGRYIVHQYPRDLSHISYWLGKRADNQRLVSAVGLIPTSVRSK